MSFSSNLGRWLEEDSIGIDAGDQNLYRYVENNPATLLDPWGQQPVPKDYPLRAKPRPLAPNEVAEICALFPNFNPRGVYVLGEKDPSYNCIAHAFGLKGGIIDSNTPPPGSKIETPGDWMTGSYMDQVAQFYGYTRSKSCDPEVGKIKIAVYGKEYRRRTKPGEPPTFKYTILHAAVETGDGAYTCKNGTEELLRFPALVNFSGGEDQRGLYGKLLYCYEKPAVGANKHLKKGPVGAS